MVQKKFTGYQAQQKQTTRLFYQDEPQAITFHIQDMDIDWNFLISKRKEVLRSVDAMPGYLLKPEVMKMLEIEKHLTFRLIMDLMWTTGASISEVLSLTPSSFIYEGYVFGVTLKMRSQKPGRPSKADLQRSTKRFVPIYDAILQDRIFSYLESGHFQQNQLLFPIVRQTVNRHIHALVTRVGGAPFKISSYTFRHSFAIHLLLHGRPKEVIQKYLGHRSLRSTDIYANVLTFGGEDFLKGVNFH